jgi:serine/threonine-protein kinase/endoribonuclease IRE1
MCAHITDIHINKVLGHGSSGTVVYEGMLHGRKVAVKRMLADFYQLAYREISLLLVADEHNHVVSYYAKVGKAFHAFTGLVHSIARKSADSMALSVRAWCRRRTTSSSIWRCLNA